jgi:chemotaxis protein methyltransferase CheR
MMDMTLEDATFRQLRDFIYEKSGIFVPENKKYLLEKKLAARLEERKFRTYEEYLPYVRGANGSELPKLFDAVTVNETYFFREPNQLDVFVKPLAARILEQKGKRELKIWSAACSTGEEPYTIAMLLMEKKPCSSFEILASDISNEVLEAARKGAYGSYSTRNVPEPYLSKYFTTKGTVRELDPTVKNAVKFMNINLVDESKTRAVQSADVIFCRNVLIYFDDKSKQKAVALLYNSLRPGGYLVIGAAESLHNVTRAFRPVIFDKVVAYQRT